MSSGRRLGLLAAILLGAPAAAAAPPTPGYPEPVIQWGVQKGETCEDIARALYGSPKYAVLLQRYNHVACKAGAPLQEGTTLVLPEKPTVLPDAKLRSMNPDVRARPGGGGWSSAAPGMPLYSNYNVNTLDSGRADVEFIDRTRVFLAPNTLVVIYGTASQTRVSRTAPAAVEVEAGEVKAGLAALRGSSVEVAVKGGGRVSAASRDTVVQRKADRTTVAVFDGKAGVSSGGKTVEVPKNFGTRFHGTAAPTPPRPLPPAPVWASGGESVILAPGGVGTVHATWNPVPVAVSYRVELARDPEFHDLVAREEVPASVTAFRGEKLPVGTYYLAVRAIDKEEYLGIAAETRAVRLVEARLEQGEGRLSGAEIEASPYGVLRFGTSGEVEAALDDGPFGPMPDAIDLRRRAPRSLKVRARGSSAVETISVRYTKVAAAVEPVLGEGKLLVRVRLSGLDGVDVATRVGPSARLVLPDGARTVALAPTPSGLWLGSTAIPTVDRVRVDVIDSRGVVLGTGTWVRPDATPKAQEEPRRPQIGAWAPLWSISPATDVLWSAPTPPDGASVGVGIGRGSGAWAAQGQVRASGAIGPIGLDAALRTDTTDGKSASGAAWLGVRGRVLRFGDAPASGGSAFELAPALRVGLPLASAGAPARLEPSIAAGGLAGRFTWLADVGLRVRLAQDDGATGTPPLQGFLLAGGTADLASWARLYALLDAHLVAPDSGIAPASGSKKFLGGLAAGLEAGTFVYGSVGVRLSPFPDPGFGVFTSQLAFGFRGFP